MPWRPLDLDTDPDEPRYAGELVAAMLRFRSA